MEELRKVKRVIAKAIPDAPHEVFLVLDANTGQNALAQVKAFDAAVGLTGLIVTKLDGSAKGGVVAAIAKQHPVPIRFIAWASRSTTCSDSWQRSSSTRCCHPTRAGSQQCPGTRARGLAQPPGSRGGRA